MRRTIDPRGAHEIPHFHFGYPRLRFFFLSFFFLSSAVTRLDDAVRDPSDKPAIRRRAADSLVRFGNSPIRFFSLRDQTRDWRGMKASIMHIKHEML